MGQAQRALGVRSEQERKAQARWVAAEAVTRSVPKSISERWPVALPVWHHRAVCKAWHRAVVVARMEKAIVESGGTLAATKLLDALSFVQQRIYDFTN